ncbi:MAG: methyltransferase type 11 [uncultured bacterium]|nr:MAG: methyltransferase type 11 [uncultured bacterium]
MKQGYDRIASHFSDTRHDPWPEFSFLVPFITQEKRLLDVGCGNGRLGGAIQVTHYTGLDLSRQLLTIAQKRFPSYTFVHGSVLQLPFSNEQFDVVACVATLQHIPSIPYRKLAMQEMARVLKPNGTLFMLNWNLAEQPQYQQYRAGDEYDQGDYLIPWKNDQGEILTKRYYHGFTLPEIVGVIHELPLQLIRNEIGQDGRNILTVLTKPKK